MPSKELGLIKQNHLLHVLILLVAILVAYLKHEKLPDSDLGKGFLVLEIMEIPETNIGEAYLPLKAKVIHGDFPEIYNKQASVKLYGARNFEPGTVELEGKVRIRNNKVYITASYTDIYNFKPKEKTFRDRLLERVDEKIKDEDTKNLFKTFILGEPKDILSLSLQADFYLTGLVHILVVSGFHVGILAIFLRYLLPGKYGLLVSLGGVSFYALFIVPLNPPVFRASLMVIFVILIKLLNARHDILSILLFSVSLILFVNPELLFSYSLWLSFFATLYIILALKNSPTFTIPALEGIPKLHKSVTYFLISLWISLFAFLGTSPLISTFSYSTLYTVISSSLSSPFFFAFGVYGFLELFTFLNLPTFPLEFLTSIIKFKLQKISKFPFLLNVKSPFALALFVLILNAFFLYFLKGYHKLLALLVYVCFVVLCWYIH